MKNWLMGIIFFISFSILFSSHEAFADDLFEDEFEVDPASNGWTESTSSPNGVIFSDGSVVNFDHQGIGLGGVIVFSISRTISTSGCEDITVELIARQFPATSFEPEDFLSISVDTDIDPVIEDHEVWHGVHDPPRFPPQPPEETGTDANPIFTSTGPLAIPSASDNPSLELIITGRVDSHLENYQLDKIIITGDCIEDDQVVGGKIISIDLTSLLVAEIHYTAAWVIPIFVSIVGIGLVLVKRKH